MAVRLPKNSRRAFLVGAGRTAIALPLSRFCVVEGDVAEAQDIPAAVRLVTFYFPSGCPPEWWNYDVALQGLLPLRDKIVVFKNVKNSVAELVPGDPHESGAVILFTGAPVINGTRAAGTSIDQLAARTLDANTLLGKPLVCGVWRQRAGALDRPISWSRRSWLDGMPIEPMQNPMDIFRRIFGAQVGPAEDVQKKTRIQRSVLDSVLEHYHYVTSDSYGISQQSKTALTEHLDHIRDMEKRIDEFQRHIAAVKKCQSSVATPPSLIPADGLFQYDQFQQAFELQMTLLVKAMECGLVSTGSLMFGIAGQDYIVPGQANCDHCYSHYVNEQEMNGHMFYRKYHIGNLYRLLNAMNQVNEANGRTMLDNAVVIAGTELGEGRTHEMSPHPYLIAGGGAGRIQSGQVIDAGLTKSSNDVLATAMHAVGIAVPNYGEARFNTGIFTQILR